MSTSINYLVGLAWEGARNAKQAKKDIKDLGDTGDKAEKGLDKMSGGLDRASDSFSKFKGLAVGGALVGAGAAFANFSKQSIDAAANVEEGLSKAGEVFKSHYADTREELKLFADEANRSQYELLDMASGIQALIVPMGIARGEAADLSVEMAKLAEDLASFNNTDSEEAALALRSGLSGESEPLKKYGVLLTAARVEEEALTSGIWDGVEALTAQEKVQARYNLILRDTVDAQGDAIRTSDSYTNSVKGYEAAILDLQVAWGQELLPMMTPTVQGAAGGIRGALDYTQLTLQLDAMMDSGQLGAVDRYRAEIDYLSGGKSAAGSLDIVMAIIEQFDAIQAAASSSDYHIGRYGAQPAGLGASGYPSFDYGGSTPSARRPAGSMTQTPYHNLGYTGVGGELAQMEADAQTATLAAWTQAWMAVEGPVSRVIEAQAALDAAPLEEQAQALELMTQASEDLETAQKQWIFDLILGEEMATQKTMDLAVAMGLITQAEADLRAESAQTKQVLEEMAGSWEFAAINANSQADAIDRIIGGMSRGEAMRRSTIDSEADEIGAWFNANKDTTISAGNVSMSTEPAFTSLGNLYDTVEDDWSNMTFDATLGIDDEDALDDIGYFDEKLNDATRDRVSKIYVQEIPAGDGGGGGGGTGNEPEDSFAQGGSLTVPPGYPSDGYMIAVSSGEFVEVTPFGQSKKGGGLNINIVNHITGPARVDLAQIERVQKHATIQALKEEGVL